MMRWISGGGSDKELNSFFQLLLTNENLFACGQARLTLTAPVFFRSREKLEFMRNSRWMKTRQQALQIKRVFERVIDLKLTHYDLGAEQNRSSSLRGTIDLQMFRCLQVVTLHRVPLLLVENLAVISGMVRQLNVHQCLYSISELRGNVKDMADRQSHPKWSSLEVLDLGHNWVEGVDDSMAMLASTNLNTFIFSYNQLESFYDHLTYLPVMKKFDASFNRLTTVPSLAPTVYNHLSKLVLCSNRLLSLHGIGHMYYLEFLDVRDNFIARHSNLADLEKLHIVKHVLLAGNPICTNKNHFLKTLYRFSSRALQNLPVLDDVRVTCTHIEQLSKKIGGSRATTTMAASSSSDVQSTDRNISRLNQNTFLSIVEDFVPQMSRKGSKESPSSSKADRKDSKGITKRANTATSHVSRNATNGLKIPLGPKISSSSSPFKTSTPILPGKRNKPESFSKGIESPVMFADEAEVNKLVNKYRDVRNDMGGYGIQGILNDLIPPDDHSTLSSVKSKSESARASSTDGGGQFSSGQSTSAPAIDRSSPDADSELGSRSSGAAVKQKLSLESKSDIGFEHNRTRSSVVVELSSVQAFEYLLTEEESSKFVAHNEKSMKRCTLSLFRDMVISTSADGTISHEVELKTISAIELTPKYEAGMILVKIRFPSQLRPTVIFGFSDASPNGLDFVEKSKKQHQVCLSINPKCAECNSSVIVFPESTENGFCPNCEKNVTSFKNDAIQGDASSSVNKARTSNINIASQVDENSDYFSAYGGADGEKEHVVVRMRLKKRHADALRESFSSNRDSRNSQSFYPSSFTQDGSDLLALRKEMDGFVEPIVQLEHRLHLHLFQLFEEYEDFQQLFKGYLSTSDHPEMFPCVIVITSCNIRFFHIVSTDDAAVQLENIDSWFVSIGSFQFESLWLFENGLSNQSVHFKFQDSNKTYVFVAFSRELVSDLVDVVVRWCLKYNYVKYCRSDNILTADVKMMEKLVLRKLKGVSVSSLPQHPTLGHYFPESVLTAIKEQSWMCRFSAYENVLCFLSATEVGIFICAVNYFVVHATQDPIKAKPFVLLDSRTIGDVKSLTRYRSRRNVLTIHFFEKARPEAVTMSAATKASSKQHQRNLSSWSIKLGNMKQVSSFASIVQQKWEAMYCTSMINEVLPAAEESLRFFDD